MLSFVDRWFEPFQASQEYKRVDYILLFLLLAGGAWLRFWHLGYVGLHGDEDIMGLAARGVLAQGVPELPSGLVYWRAPLHTYLMAGSTLLLGDTEWALRLPSAIVGSLCGFLAFHFGKRFLDPKPNLAFVALVTFLPAMIEISQTARMYVFFVASLLVYGILLFRWERERTTSSFLWTLFSLLAAIQFHQLAVFAAPMLLFAGLANRSWSQLRYGIIGLIIAYGFTEVIGYIAHQDYPDESERLIVTSEETLSASEVLLRDHLLLVAIGLLALMTVISLIAILKIENRRPAMLSMLFFTIGAGACGLLHYHIGVLATLVGAMVWLRSRTGSNWRLLAMLMIMICVAILQWRLLESTGVISDRSLITYFIGAPSIWPAIQLLQFSPIGSALLIAGVCLAFYRFIHRERIPLFVMFLVISVWAPVVVLGLFKWYTAERYTLGPLPFYLLCVAAAGQYIVGEIARTSFVNLKLRRSRFAVGVIATSLVLLAVNLVKLQQVARNDYSNHPDHKGAAACIRQIHASAGDIIIAEDSIVQTYYLGAVDYRLQDYLNAKNHSRLRDGILYGQYTGTRVIGSGTELIEVLDGSKGVNVYVISSGQGSQELRSRNRGNGIAEVLRSKRLMPIFKGRDGKTTVWKLRR